MLMLAREKRVAVMGVNSQPGAGLDKSPKCSSGEEPLAVELTGVCACECLRGTWMAQAQGENRLWRNSSSSRLVRGGQVG